MIHGAKEARAPWLSLRTLENSIAQPWSINFHPFPPSMRNRRRSIGFGTLITGFGSHRAKKWHPFGNVPPPPPYLAIINLRVYQFMLNLHSWCLWILLWIGNGYISLQYVLCFRYNLPISVWFQSKIIWYIKRCHAFTTGEILDGRTQTGVRPSSIKLVGNFVGICTVSVSRFIGGWYTRVAPSTQVLPCCYHARCDVTPNGELYHKFKSFNIGNFAKKIERVLGKDVFLQNPRYWMI